MKVNLVKQNSLYNNRAFSTKFHCPRHVYRLWPIGLRLNWTPFPQVVRLDEGKLYAFFVKINWIIIFTGPVIGFKFFFWSHPKTSRVWQSCCIPPIYPFSVLYKSFDSVYTWVYSSGGLNYNFKVIL